MTEKVPMPADPSTHLLGDALDSFAPTRKPHTLLSVLGVTLLTLMMVATCLGVSLSILLFSPVTDKLIDITHAGVAEDSLWVYRDAKRRTLRFTTALPFVEEVPETIFDGLAVRVLNTQPYSAEELSHLRDVRTIIGWALMATYVLVLVNCVIVSVAKQTQIVRRALLTAGIICVLFPLIIAAALMLDFGWTFMWFHQLLFPQGNWTFPSDSLLITVSPEYFWRLCGMLWMGLLLLLGGITIGISRFCGKKHGWSEVKLKKSVTKAAVHGSING